MRVLQTDEPRARRVVIVNGPNAVDELLERQHAAVAFDRLRRHAEELAVRALLVVVDVAIGFAEEFVARPAVDADPELVAHRARGNEQGRFLAEHLGDPRFAARRPSGLRRTRRRPLRPRPSPRASPAWVS